MFKMNRFFRHIALMLLPALALPSIPISGSMERPAAVSLLFHQTALSLRPVSIPTRAPDASGVIFRKAARVRKRPSVGLAILDVAANELKAAKMNYLLEAKRPHMDFFFSSTAEGKASADYFYERLQKVQEHYRQANSKPKEVFDILREIGDPLNSELSVRRMQNKINKVLRSVKVIQELWKAGNFYHQAEILDTPLEMAQLNFLWSATVPELERLFSKDSHRSAVRVWEILEKLRKGEKPATLRVLIQEFNRLQAYPHYSMSFFRVVRRKLTSIAAIRKIEQYREIPAPVAAAQPAIPAPAPVREDFFDVLRQGYKLPPAFLSQLVAENVGRTLSVADILGEFAYYIEAHARKREKAPERLRKIERFLFAKREHYAPRVPPFHVLVNGQYKLLSDAIRIVGGIDVMILYPTNPLVRRMA